MTETLEHAAAVAAAKQVLHDYIAAFNAVEFRVVAGSGVVSFSAMAVLTALVGRVRKA